MPDRFRIVDGFPEPLRRATAELYVDAFADKLAPVLGRDLRTVGFFADIIDPAYCLSAVSADGSAVLGLVGFKTGGGALADGSLRDLVRHYGRFGALWRSAVLGLLERDAEPAVFLLDGIAVAPQARGLGIGTALLEAVEDRARSRGVARVRLDVVDTNPRARALYERQGYVAVSQDRMGPLRHVFGFSASTRMEKRLDGPQATGSPSR